MRFHHNHLLERLHYPDDTTEYIVSGAGGSNYRGRDLSSLKSSQAESLFSHYDNGFVWIAVSERQLRVEFFDADGKNFTNFREKNRKKYEFFQVHLNLTKMKISENCKIAFLTRS